MSYIRELERGRSFALFSFFSGEAKPGKPPLKDTLYSCFYIDGGVRANREPMTFILPPFADSPPLFTIEICGFSLSSAAAEKKPGHCIHEVLLRMQSCWVSDAPFRTVIEATLAHHRKFSGISSSREIGERANGEHSLRKKFEIQVKAFCADCTIFYQKPTCPPNICSTMNFSQCSRGQERCRGPELQNGNGSSGMGGLIADTATWTGTS